MTMSAIDAEVPVDSAPAPSAVGDPKGELPQFILRTVVSAILGYVAGHLATRRVCKRYKVSAQRPTIADQ
jgi:hypothetical protein